MTDDVKFDCASLILCPPNGDREGDALGDANVLAEMTNFFVEPRLSHVFCVGGSRIGVIFITCSWPLAFADRRRLIQAAADGAEWAAARGAQCVSMTGTIPAARLVVLAVVCLPSVLINKTPKK
jgi:hypothetical protein